MTSKICRVCFDEGDDFNSLGVGNGSNGHKLSCCVPEIDVYIVGDPAICKPCLSMVQVAYALRETCIENEKKFNGKFKSACVVTKSEDTLPQIDGCDTDFIVYNDYFNEIGNAAAAQETNESSERNVDEKEYLCPKCRRSFRSPNGVNAHYRYCRKKPGKTNKKKTEDKSEEELVKSVNEMCATIDDFEEKPSIAQCDVDASFELFSDDDGSFELNLDVLNLFDANDEVPPSDRSPLFKCKICGASFVSGKYLDVHLKTHDPSDEHTKSCGICDKSFDNFGSILLHLLEHTGEDELYCGDCNVKFKSKALKRGHRCTRFACGICGQVCFSKRDVHTHNKSHHHNETAPQPCKEYQCKLCLTVCYSESSYQKHLKRHETAAKLEETCQLCGDNFETALLLKRHIIEKHCTKEVRISLIDFKKDKSDLGARENVVLICYACKELYMNVELYLRHMRMMHNTCAVCKRKLHDINAIIKHVDEHYGYQNNVTKAKKKKRKIQNELLVNAIKIYCEQCNVEFYDDDTFKRHLREFHDYNNKCNVCTKRFPNTKELYEHMLIHVTELHTCTRCSSVFQTKLEHQVHMKEHNICEVCDKTFVHNVNLRRHMSFYHSSTTRTSRIVGNKKRKTKKVTAPSRTVRKKKQVYERCTIENGTKNNDHEEQNNVSSDPRVIQCEMCKERFDTQLKLRAHVQVHI